MSYLAGLKTKVKQLQETAFQQGWEFRVEFDVPASNPASSLVPKNFNVFVKNVKYGGFTIDYQSLRIGTANINTPESKSAGSIEMVVRDSKAMEVDQFLRALSESVVNKDGTVNLPSEYLFKIKLFKPDASGSERLVFTWEVSAETFSVDEHSYENVNQFIHYEVSFKKYRS